MNRVAIICAALALSGPARSHDVWANNEPVPPWVKSACCGPEDPASAAAVHEAA